METQRKLKKLKEIIWSLNRVVVAFSGGVDSTFLLKVCLDVLGRENVLAFIGASPIHPERETQDAVNIARELGVEFVVVSTSEMENTNFTSNTRERCYHCKSGLIDQIKGDAKSRGIIHIVEGSNLDDEKDFRPGSRAVAEKGIMSPLRAAGLTKQEIRDLSGILNLPTHDKPSFACLASRIPYGTTITKDILKKIELSEEFIKSLGLKQARVRYHGHIARIEVEDTDVSTVIERRSEINEHLNALGFTYVSLDLKGYRTGSMNEPPSGSSEL